MKLGHCGPSDSWSFCYKIEIINDDQFQTYQWRVIQWFHIVGVIHSDENLEIISESYV